MSHLIDLDPLKYSTDFRHRVFVQIFARSGVAR
jgi:hypothetical protein